MLFTAAAHFLQDVLIWWSSGEGAFLAMAVMLLAIHVAIYTTKGIHCA